MSSDGNLDLIPIPNFESPVDADGDNVFVVQITATDTAGTKAVQNLAVTIANVDEMPVIASVTQIVSVENTTAVQTLPAFDLNTFDSFTYQIVGGADQAFFDSNGGGNITGINFLNPPDHDQLIPADANGDNVYLVDIETTVTPSGFGLPGGPPYTHTDTYAV